MAGSKLIVLGIDGMDFELVSTFLDCLPNIRSLSERGLVAPLQSVFPPDSIPAWITAYTGMDPSEHGILEHVDYLDKSNLIHKVDTDVFKGKTFWDKVGDCGKRVCVINPFMAFPVWPVNGVMVSGSVAFVKDIQVSDPHLLAGIPLPASLGGVPDFPKKKELPEFYRNIVADTLKESSFGCRAFDQSQPDLYFQAFLTMDRVQHFLWRFCDDKDPSYPGSNELSGSIKDFYQLTDKIIGDFVAKLDKDDKLLILSDHGHGMRCTHCFNLNEFLRRKGLVFSKSRSRFGRRAILEALKNRVLGFMHHHDLEDYISVIARFVPNAKAMKKGKHITDSNRNVAYAAEMFGSNPFGGLCLNRAKVQDYEITRDSIIKELKEVLYQGKPLFKWIEKREQLYSGQHTEKLPDILFEMVDEVGVGWGLHTELFTVNPTHKKISGGHRSHGVVMSNRKDLPVQQDGGYHIKDIHDAIISCFGLSAKP